MSSRHLEKLPVKSYKVAKGDVVGGLIYMIDKPLGIEEGMVGISVESPGYVNYVKSALEELEEGTHQNKALQARFDTLKKNNKDFDRYDINKKVDILIHDKVHKKKRHGLSAKDLKNIFGIPPNMHEVRAFQSYYKNIGAGGLLFEGYEKACGIKPTDHFAVQIGGLINGVKSKPQEDKVTRSDQKNKVYMVKQDGQLKSGGRTGPSVRKILKTTVGRKLQYAFNPFLTLVTGGLSALVGGAIVRRWSRRDKTTAANQDAIVESLATKIAGIRGMESQEIDTIEGTYEDGSLKIGTIVTWTPGCRDLSGTLDGGSDDYSSVMIKRDEKGKPILEDGMMVSEDRVAGLGESLISFLSMGDRDGIGKKGQNKAIVPLKSPRGNKVWQFYGIDYGKAYSGKNKVIQSLSDDFSFKNPSDLRNRFVNYSMLYDNPLTEKMKGVYLLAALRNKLSREEKNKIADEYEKGGDHHFAKKLREYPKLDKGNDDLWLIKKEENKYREKYAKAKTKKEKEAYKAYADRLSDVYKQARVSDNKILDTFKQRMHLLPHQIDLLDNVEKLTAHKAYTVSTDGKVRLNHIRVDNKDRAEWQLIPNEDGTYQLVCKETEPRKRSQIFKKLNKIDELKSMNNSGENLSIQLSSENIKTLSSLLTERKVAKARDLPFRAPANETRPQKPEPKAAAVKTAKRRKYARRKTYSPGYGLEHEKSRHPIKPVLTQPNKKFFRFKEKLMQQFVKNELKGVQNIESKNLGRLQKKEGLEITFLAPKSNQKVYVKESKKGMTYSVQRDMDAMAFQSLANQLCELAVSNAVPGEVFDLSKAPEDKKDIMLQALNNAIQKAVQENRFDESNKPKIEKVQPKKQMLMTKSRYSR